MTREVVAVRRSTTLAELIGIFRKFNFHTIPVVEENNRLVGVVTFEDILSVFQPYSSELTRMLKTVPFLGTEEKEEELLLADISGEIGVLAVVDDFMNTQLITVKEEMPITQVRSLMKLHNIGRLLVVKDGCLVGIISLFDIILAIFREKGVVE
jgi:CBS domain-containing protein